MRWMVLLAEALAFAALVTLGHGLLGRWGVLVVVAGWLAAWSAYILATVPAPELSRHDFERDPVPALLALLGGTVAAAAFTVIYRGNRPPLARGLMTAGVYLLVYMLVGIPAALVSLG